VVTTPSPAGGVPPLPVEVAVGELLADALGDALLLAEAEAEAEADGEAEADAEADGEAEADADADAEAEAEADPVEPEPAGPVSERSSA
jgi:chemosensory pili system protein ChpA (sensor histidine kinase/response regulator)